MNSIIEKAFVVVICVFCIWWFAFDWIAQELPDLSGSSKIERQRVEDKPRERKQSPKAAKVAVMPPVVPEGIAFPKTYYTKERISLVTENGVQSIARGQRVDAVKQDDGRFLIRAGKAELVVSAEQITADAAEIREVTR